MDLFVGTVLVSMMRSTSECIAYGIVLILLGSIRLETSLLLTFSTSEGTDPEFGFLVCKSTRGAERKCRSSVVYIFPRVCSAFL